MSRIPSRPASTLATWHGSIVPSKLNRPLYPARLTYRIVSYRIVQFAAFMYGSYHAFIASRYHTLLL
jgi:hypothetical protein